MDKYMVEILIKTTGECITKEVMASSQTEAESMQKNSIRWTGYELKDLEVVQTTKLTNAHIKKLG